MNGEQLDCAIKKWTEISEGSPAPRPLRYRSVPVSDVRLPLPSLSTERTEILFRLVKRQDVFFTFHVVYARLNTISWADLSLHLST